MVLADYVRIVVAIALLGVIAWFPFAAWHQGRSATAWLAVASAELAYFAGLMEVMDHMGRPLVWYRAPLLGASVFIMYVFLLSATFKED